MQNNGFNFEGLRDSIRQAVEDFAYKIKTGLGDNLVSLTITGSSLGEDYIHGKSDINTVIVLDAYTLESLDRIAAMAKWMAKRKITAPLLMTEDYIVRSLDVFGIEVLDFQMNHKTIYGADPFAELKIEKKDVRLQCERELMAALIRMRQGYTASAANKAVVRDILIAAVSSLVPILRAMLWLKNIERPRQAAKVFGAAADEYGFVANMLVTVGSWKHKNIQLDEPQMRKTFDAVYTLVDQLTLTVDRLEV